VGRRLFDRFAPVADPTQDRASGLLDPLCSSGGRRQAGADIFKRGARRQRHRPGDRQDKLGLAVFDKRTVSSPVLAGGLIMGTCGSGAGGNYVAAVRPPDGGDSATPELVYKIDKSAPYVPTPVAKGDLVFLWSDQGVATCIRAASGEVVWRERVGGNFSGSPVIVSDHIYCISDDGEVVVLAAAPEYSLVSRQPLGEECRSVPAVAAGVMYLRTCSHLFSLGGERPR